MTSCDFLRLVLAMKAEVGGVEFLRRFGVVTQDRHLRVCSSLL